MSTINIRRAVENIRSGTTVYTPVIELIVNAIQAIRVVRATGGRITVTILREGQVDLIDRIAAVDGFVVEDDGVGFDQQHRDSFDELYSALKAEEGGKGFGRFTCLKYFERFRVESVFADGQGVNRSRSFGMGLASDIIVDEVIADTDAVATGSRVMIEGARGVRFPDKGIDVIARVLVERLLPYFIDRNSECPRIVVVDGGDGATIVLNDYLSRENRQIVELSVEDQYIALTGPDQAEPFEVRIFKFYAPRTSRSKIALVAHRREVTDVAIQTYIPEFADEFYDKGDEGAAGRDRNYVVKAYVFGDYLDRNVSLERGAFNFQRDSDLIYGISQAQIEARAADTAREASGARSAHVGSASRRASRSTSSPRLRGIAR